MIGAPQNILVMQYTVVVSLWIQVALIAYFDANRVATIKGNNKIAASYSNVPIQNSKFYLEVSW